MSGIFDNLGRILKLGDNHVVVNLLLWDVLDFLPIPAKNPAILSLESHFLFPPLPPRDARAEKWL